MFHIVRLSLFTPHAGGVKALAAVLDHSSAMALRSGAVLCPLLYDSQLPAEDLAKAEDILEQSHALRHISRHLCPVFKRQEVTSVFPASPRAKVC